MSRLARFTSFILLGSLLVVLGQGAGAADAPPAGAAPAVDTSLIPEDAIVACVAYPRRVLTSPALAKLDIKPLSLADEMGEKFGFSLLNVEQVLTVFSDPGPEQPGRQGKPNVAGVVFHLAKPHAGREFAAKMMASDKPDEVEIAGKKCFRPAKNPQVKFQRTSPCVYFPDERTIVIGDLETLEKMLTAKDVQSPLAEELRTLDPAVNVAVAFNNHNGTALATVLKEAHLPESLSGLPDVLTTARLTIKTAPDVSVALELAGKDEAAAGRLAQMADAGKQLSETALSSLKGQVPRGLPSEGKAPLEELLRLAEKIVGGLTPQRTGNRVTVQIEALTKSGEFATKVVLPVIAARRAAMRTFSRNSVKQLVLAILASENMHGRLPSRGIYTKDGKPLLSWRVNILPFIDQQDLYNQFHLDEPWDSPNNKALIARMPGAFYSAFGKHNGEGRTQYVVPFGKGTAFEGEEGVTMAEITDGTANTIALIEVADDKSVIWTKPDDLAFDSEHPLAGLGIIGDEGILAGFADGHVQCIRKDVDPEIFRRMIIRNDGLPVEPAKYQPK